MTALPSQAAKLDACACCEGVERLTPVSLENAPGLSALVYRVGTHGPFKATMHAELSRQAALSGLTTRDDDDASLALLDAGAAMLDVLTFYQERIANEGYLRTATERRSLLELARAIGYELRPGVAAGAYIAFKLEDAPGAPKIATIEAGTRAQSVPGPGEEPQTFETVEAIEARAEWNGMRPRLTKPQTLSPDMGSLWLVGVTSNLNEGDRILIVAANPGEKPVTQVRRVLSVEADYKGDRTEVILDPQSILEPAVHTLVEAGVWALRVKTAPFGHGAPRKTKLTTSAGVTTTSSEEWGIDTFDKDNKKILTLDGEFDQIHSPSYVVISGPAAAGSGTSHSEVLSVQRSTAVSRASYGITGRVTQLELTSEWHDVDWSGWASLGGMLTSGPAVASWSWGRLDVFVRDQNNALGHKWYDKGWSEWESLGGVLTSDPAAVSWGKGRIDVFVRGSNNALWHKWYDKGWSEWESLGGVLTSGPAVASWSSGRLDVFVRGTNNALWHKWYDKGWSEWESLGGVLTSDPAAVSWGKGRIDVFVRGSNNALWHKWYEKGWSGWESLAGVLTSGPAAASWSSGRLDVFVRGQNNALWHKWYDKGWSEWKSLGGTLTSDPDAVSWSKGRIDVDVRGANNGLSHKWFRQTFELKDLGSIREIGVHAQTEALKLAEQPLDAPLYGGYITLDTVRRDLMRGQPLSVSGKALRLRVRDHATGLKIVLDTGQTGATLEPGDVVTVLTPPEVVADDGELMPIGPKDLMASLKSAAPVSLRWHVKDRGRARGVLVAPSDAVEVRPSAPNDPILSEIISIGDGPFALTWSRDATLVALARPLQNCFDRTSVSINANVAPATHGETRREVLGSGDASKPFQTFTLKQTPLTYVQAATPSGGRSTLEVRVNEILWHEAPSLYGRGPKERIYATRMRDDGKVIVQFGDGKTGARLPTGTENVVAIYRVGVGLHGNVEAGQLTTLLSRPLGLREASNPLPAEGGADPESRDRARQNAPLTVRTLERAVSLLDYEDFARTFSGIGKAQAVWLWNGEARVVHLTVAGDAGEVLGYTSKVMTNLLDALQTYRDPLVQVELRSHEPVSFKIEAGVAVQEDYEEEKVLAAVRAALRQAFSFEAREFGQAVTRSEVLAVIQSVPGVIAVDLNALFSDPQAPDLNPVRLLAQTARWNAQAKKIDLGQILTLAEGDSAIKLSEMEA